MTDNESLQQMLDEVRKIREELSVLSESAKQITKAIEGVLGDKVRHVSDGAGYLEEGDFHYDDPHTEQEPGGRNDMS
jgi:hypothetical protein